MRHYIFLFIFLITAILARAQYMSPSIYGTGPDTNAVSSTNYTLEYTLGQFSETSSSSTTNYIITPGFQQSGTDHVFDSIPEYEIGEIPDQIVWHGTVHKLKLTSTLNNALFSYEILNGAEVSGRIALLPQLGNFYYMPSEEDILDFEIRFKAKQGNDSVMQTVLYSVMPHLPEETATFGFPLTGGPDDEDDLKFITINEVESDVPEDFNNAVRTTRNIGIAGKTIIFEDGHANNLYLYNENDDIKNLTIYAENVVIRDDLHFPQTNVTIYAEKLIFEDTEGEAPKVICTTPRSIDIIDPGDGANGLPAGNITLHIKKLYANFAFRFRMIGGTGQDANGTPGAGGDAGSLSASLQIGNFADITGGSAGIDQSAPLSYPARGNSGEFNFMDYTYSWLHPYALKMIGKHTRNAYFNNYFDFAYSISEKYARAVYEYKDCEDWDSINTSMQLELEQNAQLFNMMAVRIANNVDFYGNPFGWVPMLSFEANLAAYQSYVDHAIDVSYLSYWINNAAETIEEKADALESTRDNLKTELDNVYANFEETSMNLDELMYTAQAIIDERESIREDLETIRTGLIFQANLIHDMNQRLGMIGNIMKRHESFDKHINFTPSLGGISLSGSLANNIKESGEKFGGIGGLEDMFIDIEIPTIVTGFESEIDLINFSEIDLLSQEELNGYMVNINEWTLQLSESLDEIQTSAEDYVLPQEELHAIFEDLKANSPEYNAVVARIHNLMQEKIYFQRSMSNTLNLLSSYANLIQQKMLETDALNRDIIQQNNIVDMRAMTALNEMETNALERLQKYHYYMAKAYEYRILEAYPGNLNVQDLYDSFQTIADTAANHNLTGDAFDALKTVYEEEISSVVSQIYDEYNTNSPELSVPIRFNLTDEEKELLNTTGEVTINLVEKGIFPESEENIRIVSFSIYDLDMHFENGEPGDFAYFDLYLKHSGLSKLKKDGEYYHFRHYNTESEHPIVWGARYDAYDGLTNPIEPSAASQSLLKALLQSLGLPTTDDELLLYSRPSAWADIVIKKEDHSSNGVDMVVDLLRLELQYDFMNRPEELVNIEILTSDPKMMPYFDIDPIDNNEREDGRGNTHRSYSIYGKDDIIISAQEYYGIYKFEKWTDRFGNDLDPPKKIRKLHCQRMI
jgi:hypothetical protein